MTDLDKIADEIDRIERKYANIKKRGYPKHTCKCFTCGRLFESNYELDIDWWLKWEENGRKPFEREECFRCERQSREENE